MKAPFASLAAALALLSGCSYPYAPRALPPATTPAPPANAASAPAEQRPPVTILVSIDGFRPDYLDRGVTPNLSRLAAGGVTAAMRPSFPSKTAPNHWTLVTGLVPDHHGVVANTMEDAARAGEVFSMSNDDPFWWNGGEPLWVTAEKAGIRTATMFWPGSNVAWGGVRDPQWPHPVANGTRPHDWQEFNQQITGHQRVDAVIDWLRRPAATRPAFVTLYFDTVDTAGHTFGPAAPEMTATVAQVDGWIGELVAGLATLGQPANLVIVADHGMAPTSSTRTIALDTIVPPADARIIDTGPFATFVPTPGREDAVARALLAPHPHMQCWRRQAIPARFRYGTNPRIPPFFCLAEDGPAGAWTIAKTAPAKPFTGGAHGYDNDAVDMRALFIANGPAFATGRRIATFDNVDIAPLIRDLLGLPPGQRLDGDDRPFRGVLRR